MYKTYIKIREKIGAEEMEYNIKVKGYTALYNFVKMCEVLPICEAEVERIYSSMGRIINKLRTRTKCDVLDAFTVI